ncbi:MAG: V-type ATP synthase subunit E, partial [Promethearchaeota archaeon]
MSNISSSDQIEQMIISEAKADAKQIIQKAEVSARELIEVAQENAQSTLSGWADRRKQMAERSGDRIIGKARNDAHMRIMSAKAKMIDTAFQEAQTQFEKERGTARYKAFLKNLIINAGIQVGGGDLIVLARK